MVPERISCWPALSRVQYTDGMGRQILNKAKDNSSAFVAMPEFVTSERQKVAFQAGLCFPGISRAEQHSTMVPVFSPERCGIGEISSPCPYMGCSESRDVSASTVRRRSPGKDESHSASWRVLSLLPLQCLLGLAPAPHSAFPLCHFQWVWK